MRGDGLTNACLDEIEKVLSTGPRHWSREPTQLVDDGVLAVRVNVIGQTEDPAGHENIAHLDIELDLGAASGKTRVVTDYTAGSGPSVEAQAAAAVKRWAETTAPVLFELLEQDGDYATNRYASDPLGLNGWHVIEGPPITKGSVPDGAAMSAWLEANPLLPLLENETLPAIAGLTLPAIRIVFGGNGTDDLAEVAIDGTPDNDISALLASLDWPRPTGLAVTNIFILGVHDATD